MANHKHWGLQVGFKWASMGFKWASSGIQLVLTVTLTTSNSMWFSPALELVDCIGLGTHMPSLASLPSLSYPPPPPVLPFHLPRCHDPPTGSPPSCQGPGPACQSASRMEQNLCIFTVIIYKNLFDYLLYEHSELWRYSLVFLEMYFSGLCVHIFLVCIHTYMLVYFHSLIITLTCLSLPYQSFVSLT